MDTTISWEQKREMLTLSNNGKTKEFLQFIVDNMDQFDEQAWDMAITAIDISPVGIDKYQNHYIKIYERTKGMRESFSYVTNLRLALLNGYCKSELPKGEATDLDALEFDTPAPKKEVMSEEDKKKKLTQLRRRLTQAWNLSNELIGQEEHSHTKNGNHLYGVREEIDQAKLGLSFVKYPE